MKCKKNFFLKYLSLFTLAIIVIPLFANFVYSQVNINATIQISVCGNSIIEGGENCEGLDLNSQTCQSLGYESGNLTCDIACSFDTYNCVPFPTPTPTPTPTITPTSTITPTPTITPTSVPTFTPTPGSASSSSTTQSPTNTPTPLSLINFIAPKIVLPDRVNLFDLDGSGRIEIDETYNTVKYWVSEWREILLLEINETSKERNIEIVRCDINNDKECNIKDFSILMFYIGK